MNPRSALVAGASGLVGRAVLDELVADPLYGEIHVIARRPLALDYPRVTARVVDFNRLDALALPHIDDVYCCLGTTQKAAGSRDAFRLVDYTYVMEVARAALRAGASRCGLVSAGGTSLRSPVFYSRVKAQAERDIVSLGFSVTAIARPSLITGERARLGQPRRSGEGLALVLLQPLAPFIPARWRPVAASAVARALVRGLTQPAAMGVQIIESDVIQAFVNERACAS